MQRTIQYADTLVYYDGLRSLKGTTPMGAYMWEVLIDIQDDYWSVSSYECEP